MVFNTIFTNVTQQFASSKIILTGNVGIGTSILRQLVDVQDGNMIVSGLIGIGTTIPVNTLSVNNNASFGTYSGTVAPANSIIISGNVGIGTTNPRNILSLGANGAAFLIPDGSNYLAAARAFVNFNGADGTMRKFFGVSGVGKNGNGDYTITFDPPMPDASYALVCTGVMRGDVGNSSSFQIRCTGSYGNPPTLMTDSQVRLVHTSSTGTNVDTDQGCVVVFR